MDSLQNCQRKMMRTWLVVDFQERRLNDEREEE